MNSAKTVEPPPPFEPGVFEPLPWLEVHWQRLWAAHRADRLPHAVLVAGPPGIGKRHFSRLFSAALMCQRPGADGLPCGECADCRLVRAGTHPDLAQLGPDPEAKSDEIRVDAVREACARQSLTAQRGPRAVLSIAPAEAMNPYAANALLKTLEEPADSTLLLLITEDPGALPATVRSRCQRINMLAPAAEVASPWVAERLPDSGTGADAALLLRLAHGAPLQALRVADRQWLEARSQTFARLLAIAAGKEDPLSVAAAWQHMEPALVLEWLAGWVADLIRCQASADAGILNNPDRQAELAALASSLSAPALHRHLQQIMKAKAVANASINEQLLLEALLMRWAQLTLGAR
jgi:DNA polymerase-3 subunit delta'